MSLKFICSFLLYRWHLSQSFCLLRQNRRLSASVLSYPEVRRLPTVCVFTPLYWKSSGPRGCFQDTTLFWFSWHSKLPNNSAYRYTFKVWLHCIWLSQALSQVLTFPPIPYWIHMAGTCQRRDWNPSPSTTEAQPLNHPNSPNRPSLPSPG